MQTVTVPASRQSATVVRSRPARVYVDGRRRADLKLLTWEVVPGPEFGRATLALHPSRLSPAEGRIEELASLPAVGTSVLLRPAPDSSGEMRGVVTAHIAAYDEDDERLTAEVTHGLGVRLAGTVVGSWRLVDGKPQYVADAAAAFNVGADARASAKTYSIHGRAARVFDSSATAVEWTVADALAYLLAACVPAEVVVPSAEELSSLAGEVPLGALNTEGRSVAWALGQAAGRAGLAVRAARSGIGLVLYRPGIDGRRASVRLQRAGASFRPSGSNTPAGRVRLLRRPARPGVIALGERKRYESTFTLQPGWEESLGTDRWRDTTRTYGDNFTGLADVYRKWVLNEHGRYSDGPWGLDAYDFSPLSNEDFPLRVARRFLPCLSADESGASLGVIVESRLGPEAGWLLWPGPAWVSPDECTIRLGGDTLPGAYFQAAAAGTAELRVTATVEADARLRVEIPGDAGVPPRVVPAPAGLAWQRVHPASIFHGESAIGPADERDDTERLRKFAEAQARRVQDAMRAELTLGWIDTNCHVGDFVERIDGRGLELAARPDARPCVHRVVHDFGSTQTTTLFVTG